MSDNPEALRRLWPIIEKAVDGLVFTADKAGEVAADMATVRAALAQQAATPTYTDAVGQAGNDYHARFPHAHPLPALWRWSELWEAMSAAARQAATPASVRERWNIDRDGDALRVCFNDHEKGERCTYQRFVPERQAATPAPAADIDLLKRVYINLCGQGPKIGTAYPLLTQMREAIERLAATPAPAERDDFLNGICVALQAVRAADEAVLWGEIVRAVGVDALLNYAAHVEPDEWELAGFDRYAEGELRRRKPRKPIAAPPATPAAQPAEPEGGAA